jgi:hypothetical protein
MLTNKKPYIEKLNNLSERIQESLKPLNSLENKLKINSGLSQNKIDFLVYLNQEFKSLQQPGYIYLNFDEMSKDANSLNLFVNDEYNKRLIFDYAIEFEQINPHVHVSKPEEGIPYSFIYFNSELNSENFYR